MSKTTFFLDLLDTIFKYFNFHLLNQSKLLNVSIQINIQLT